MTTKRTLYTTLIAAIALFASGCYTQIQTTHHDRPTMGERVAADRTVAGQSAMQERSGEIISEQDYAMGYEDGWLDAEAYYFVDYEARDWYLRHGSSVVNNRHFRSSFHWHRPFYGFYGYDPFFAYWHTPFYARYHWHFGVSFGHSWFRPYHPAYYSWYRFPGYSPYYGYWGYTRPYFGYVYLGGSSSTRAVRNYGPRTTYLSSRDARVNRTTRTDARVQQAGTVRSRTDVRSAARTTQVNRAGTTTTIRNRTTSGNSSGTVNRGTTTTTRSSGTVNRGSSSTNRGSGTVNRGSSSTNRSSGTVNRNSSSTNRSSGTVNRNSSSTNRSSETVNRGSSSTNQSSGTVNRNSNNQHSSLFSPERRPTTTITMPSTAQQQSVQSVRSRILEPSGTSVTRSTSHADALRATMHSRTSRTTAGDVLRTIYNSAQSSGAAPTVTRRAASTVNRSSGSSATVRGSSSSTGRSSSVSRSSGSSSSRSSGSSTSRSRN